MKTVNVIKSWPLMQVFWVFCVMTWEVSKKHACSILKDNECLWLSQGKHFEIIWVATELAAFFPHVAPFYFQEPQADKLWLFRLEYLTFYWKQMKWICQFKKSTDSIFFPKDKTQAFRQKFWFLENLCVLPRAQQHPDIKRLFWLWWWYYQMWFFWYWVMKYVST